jgi:hypothetical protein
MINSITTFNFECGHDIAKCKGGFDTVENLIPICSTCNKSMGSKSIQEFVQVLKPDAKSTVDDIIDNINININKAMISLIAEKIYNNKDLYDKWSANFKQNKPTVVNLNICKAVLDLIIG